MIRVNLLHGRGRKSQYVSTRVFSAIPWHVRYRTPLSAAVFLGVFALVLVLFIQFLDTVKPELQKLETKASQTLGDPLAPPMSDPGRFQVESHQRLLINHSYHSFVVVKDAQTGTRYIWVPNTALVELKQ